MRADVRTGPARPRVEGRWPKPPDEIPRVPPAEVPNVPERIPGPAREVPPEPTEVPPPLPEEVPEPDEEDHRARGMHGGRDATWNSRSRPST